MSELKTKVVLELSARFPSDLVDALVSSYEKVVVEFRKGAWDETLWKAGKFTENVFRLLCCVVHGKAPSEVSNIRELKKELEDLPSDIYPDSVRLLIPRIASAMIYDPRSKKGAVHVKPVDPDYMDATLVVSACDWVLAELIRLYHTKEPKEIQDIIRSIVARKVPFVERHGEEVFVVVPLGAEDEILLLLLDNRDGFNRSDIGKSIGIFYAPPRVTEALHALQEKRFIVPTSDGRYVITGPGESHISALILRMK